MKLRTTQTYEAQLYERLQSKKEKINFLSYELLEVALILETLFIAKICYFYYLANVSKFLEKLFTAHLESVLSFKKVFIGKICYLLILDKS